jgi:predicted nucleic acid-binding protein
MKDRIFIDTNIFVYSAVADSHHANRRQKAIELIQSEDHEIVISTQVLNEFSVILIKNGIGDDAIQKRVAEIIENTTVNTVTTGTILSAWEIRHKYKFSYWDSLIVAAALERECSKLFTEDLQHGQIIDKKLKIINPFSEKL